MGAKENKGRPVRGIQYIKPEPNSLHSYKTLCEFHFEIPSAQSKDRNIITYPICNVLRLVVSNHSREAQLLTSWQSVQHLLCGPT